MGLVKNLSLPEVRKKRAWRICESLINSNHVCLFYFFVWLLCMSRLTNCHGRRKPRSVCLRRMAAATATVTMPAGRDARISVTMPVAATVANRWASWRWPRLATWNRPTHAPTITSFASPRLRCRRRRLAFSTIRRGSRMWPFCPHQLIRQRHTARRVTSTTRRPWPNSKRASLSIRRTRTPRSNWAAPTRKTLNRSIPTMEVHKHCTHCSPFLWINRESCFCKSIVSLARQWKRQAPPLHIYTHTLSSALRLYFFSFVFFRSHCRWEKRLGSTREFGSRSRFSGGATTTRRMWHAQRPSHCSGKSWCVFI